MSFIVPAGAIDIKEGKWELTMEMKMEGMPGVPAMSFTNTQLHDREGPRSKELREECDLYDP